LNNYTIKQKSDIINEYKKNVKGCGFKAIAAKHNISIGTIRGWVDKKKDIEESLIDRNNQSKKQRRLPGGGRKAKFSETVFEPSLLLWIEEKNRKGLRVKDQYITAKAINIFMIWKYYIHH
jgi:transposase